MILVRQGLTPIPEDAKGVLYVIHNKKIKVGVEGSNALMKLNMQGYYLIHKDEVKAMIGLLKKYRAKYGKLE